MPRIAFYTRPARATGAVLLGILMALSACSRDRDTASADAGEETKTLTIYVGPPTPFRTAISPEAVEQFADITGFHLEFIQFSSWYVRMEGDPPIDILDNLDLFINDDQKYYDGNPIRKRNKPDLIITSTWDSHIREKARNGYFLSVRSLFDFSPDYRKKHGNDFWDTNLRDLLTYGIPLYSFQQDDAPSYWLIDSEFRQTLIDHPIENFDDFLAFAELAVATTVGDDPIISTSTIPLGSIALAMAYGYLPLYPRADASATTVGAFGTDLTVDSPSRRYTRNPVPVPYRNLQFYGALGSFPFVYSSKDDRIVNILLNPPAGFDDMLYSIRRMNATGRLNIGKSQSQGLSSFLLGSCKALFVPLDFGLETLQSLLMMFPDRFLDRFEIVPVFDIPIASLEASVRAWIPGSTPNIEAIAELFTRLSNPEMFELLRYGSVPEYWKPDGAFGSLPGDIDMDMLYLPTGQYIEIMSRTGMPERVPGVVAAELRQAFRLEDTDDRTFTHFPSEQYVYDTIPIDAALDEWSKVADHYTRMLSGADEFAYTVSFLTTETSHALKIIESQLNRQLGSSVSHQ